MERDGATIRQYVRAAAAAGVAALLLAGCADADEPGAPAESTETAPGAAESVQSSCPGGVTLAWQGSPETTDLFTAVKVATVKDDGSASVLDEWDRGEDPGARPTTKAEKEQQAMLQDAVAGGLIGVTPAPKLADPVELLAGRDKGKYVLFAYARYSAQDATVACADDSDSLDVAVTSFKTLDTDVVSCSASPDPVAEFAAVEAIEYCEKA